VRLGHGNAAARGCASRGRRIPAGRVLLTALACSILAQGQALAAPPTLSAISPNNGPEVGGTAVTITGSGFGPRSSVRFGATPAAAVRVAGPTSITAESPAGGGTANVVVATAGARSAASPRARFAYDRPPSSPWLGLNGNNSTGLGAVGAFAQHGIVYDRSGPVEWTAGQLAQRGGVATAAGRALSADIADGMIPVVTIEYRGYAGTFSPDASFPSEAHGSQTLDEYVAGFIASATSIFAAHPGVGILLEAINEPWGYTTPRYNGAQYADVVAKLLPAAARAGIPLNEIYIAASGRHWVTQMYAEQPRLQTEIGGWYLHPYGPPSGSFAEASAGIQSLPQVQAEMTSGQNNLIVSEVGYCAENVNDGKACGGLDTSSDTRAAENLGAMLVNALPYHEAGWLRALLIYSRNDGGWAMETAGGKLTAQGRVLLAFAEAIQPLPAPLAPGSAPILDGHCLPPLGDAIAADGTLFISDGLSCGVRYGT
jgi:IPT/TIG domain-containing protein